MPGQVKEVAVRTFSSLKIRNYRYYFAGQSLSLIGTWMQSITQSWLIFTLTHSGTQVGLITAVQTLPILILGPIGGTIADRFGKYRILFWTQSLAGVQAGVLAALTLTGHLEVWELYLMAGSLGMINMVDNPTRQTFIVEMVGRDQLVNAVTLNSVMVNVARAVGPAAAGILIAEVGAGWCFLINAGSFVFVVAGLAAIHQDELTPAKRAVHMKGQLVEGFRYVARRPLLRDAIIMMAIVGCLTYEFQTTIPLLAGTTFHGNSKTYGFFTACMGVGAVVGGLIAAGRRNRSPSRMVNTLLLFSVVLLAAALAPTRIIEEVLLLFVGAGMVTFLSFGNTLLQLESEPEMRGRVMSLWSVSFLGTTPIGGPIVGFIGGTLGARYGLGLGALAALGAGCYGWHSFGRHAPAPPGLPVAEAVAEPEVTASPVAASHVAASQVGARPEPMVVRTAPSS
jgi:MFS family permease